MSNIIASANLANGLRTEFADTYMAIRNRQADSRLAKVMDLGVGATNRNHTFGYFDAAPHAEHWPRGSSIASDGNKAKSFDVSVYNWGRRVPWHMDDRADDQTGTLFDSAKGAGNSFALLPERFFFDLLLSTTTTLPGLPTAGDGVALFSATNGDGGARFGITGGNIITGGGVLNLSDILTDYYATMARYRGMQDGKGQPLFSNDILDAGVTIICGAHLEHVMEQAFIQKQQAAGMSATGAQSGTIVAGASQSNLSQDANRPVDIWPTSRIAASNDDWFVFLNGVPTPPTFLLDREGIVEQTSLMGDQSAGDHTKTTGEEFIQWHSRQGAGVAGEPFGAIQVNN